MGVLGPLARSADDLALALDGLAGPRPADAVAWSLRLPPARAGSLREYRVAAWLNDPYCPVDESVLSVLTQTVETLRHEGARIDEDARPVDLGETSRLYEALLAAAMWPGLPEPVFTAMREAARDAPGQDEPEPLLTARASTQPHRDWLLLHEQRLQLAARWAAFFSSFDVLLCPVAPTAAFPHDSRPDFADRTVLVNGQQRSYLDLSVWPGLAAAPYLPAAVVPVGRTQESLPVGMQVVDPTYMTAPARTPAASPHR